MGCGNISILGKSRTLTVDDIELFFSGIQTISLVYLWFSRHYFSMSYYSIKINWLTVISLGGGLPAVLTALEKGE